MGPRHPDHATEREIHDLRVYQVELELQRDELQRTLTELRTARDAYQDLYEFAPVGFPTLDPDRRIVEANHRLGAVLGLSALTAPISRRASRFHLPPSVGGHPAG